MSDYIEFTNEYGHRIQMSREDYLKKVVPYNLEQYWNDREKLRQFAMELVVNKFTEQAAKAADRLLELYGPIESAIIFRAVIHMQARQFDKAKAMLQECLERFPASGTACVNLAKIYAFEGDAAKAFATLEEGLTRDPNSESGLEMLIDAYMTAKRQEELVARLEQLAGQEGAWRPQYLLGKHYLQEGHLLKAVQWYKEAIERAPEKEAVIISVTGELGQAGYVYQLIQIAEAYWRPEFTYPYSGINYANALIVTDQKEKAAEVLQAMLPHVAEQYRPLVEQLLARLPQETQVSADGRPAEETDSEQKKTWWKFWQ